MGAPFLPLRELHFVFDREAPQSNSKCFDEDLDEDDENLAPRSKKDPKPKRDLDVELATKQTGQIYELEKIKHIVWIKMSGYRNSDTENKLKQMYSKEEPNARLVIFWDGK